MPPALQTTNSQWLSAITDIPVGSRICTKIPVPKEFDIATVNVITVAEAA
jgi:hypothetical protein